MPLAINSPASAPLAFLGEDTFGRGDSGVGCGAAHVGGRLRLGLGDLDLGHLGAARNEFLDLGLGFGGKPLGLGLGAGDDLLRLALGFAALAPIVGQQLGGVVLELARLVELGLDAARRGRRAIWRSCGGRRYSRAGRGTAKKASATQDSASKNMARS